MFDMIDVIQMTKISKHYLLEYQTLLDTYEMQAPNVTSGFRVLDFSDDISDVDCTSDDWSVNESYSETSGEMTNSAQANLLSNPPEYSVSAGSKPLSIIIRRCNTPSVVCSSPVQEIDEENSCTNGKSVHCDATNVFICEEHECALDSGESEKDTNWSINEPPDIVNVCNKNNEISGSKEENLICSSESISCKSPNKYFPNTVSDSENYTEEKDICDLQKRDASFIEQTEQSSISVVNLLPCVEENNENNYSFPCPEEDSRNVLGNTIQEVVDDLCLLESERENLVSSEQISCPVVSMNNTSNTESDVINVPKQQSLLRDELHHCVNDVPSSSTTAIFHQTQVDGETLNFTDEVTEDIEVNFLTSSFCLGNNDLLSNKNSEIENCVREQNTVYLDESLDIHPSEIVDGLRQLNCSPLLFSSDDESSSITEEVNRGIEAALAPSPQYNVVLSSEKRKVGKLQELLMGAPPPPAVTMPLHSAVDMLVALKDTMYWAAKEAGSSSHSSGVQWYQEAATMPWPQVRCLQYPGIHYNHGSVSEQFENLCQKLLARCVGAETASSVTVWSSFTLPAPRRERRMLSARRVSTEAPTGLSPGRRLSHLARRHRTFCSATLLNDSARLHSTLPHVAPERRTILVEGRKKESKKQRSSQKKKKSDNRDRTKDVHAMKLNSSKRALFQSPTEEDKKAAMPSKFRPSSASAVRSRRALFVAEQPESQSNGPSTSGGENASASRKRLRANSEEEMCERIPRRRLFSDTESNMRQVPNNGNNRPAELSSTHKKKLLWAVAEALKKHGVGFTHPQFRACAATLASTCRGHVQQVLALRQGSTSDHLLQLALRFVDEAVAQHIKGHPSTEQTGFNEVG